MNWRDIWNNIVEWFIGIVFFLLAVTALLFFLLIIAIDSTCAFFRRHWKKPFVFCGMVIKFCVIFLAIIGVIRIFFDVDSFVRPWLPEWLLNYFVEVYLGGFCIFMVTGAVLIKYKKQIFLDFPCYIKNCLDDFLKTKFMETGSTEPKLTLWGEFASKIAIPVIIPVLGFVGAGFELKRMSRDFKLPVIAISSFNRENYNTPVTMTAFKESGAIEYSSDVLIGLQLGGIWTREGKIDKNVDVHVAKQKDPRDIELVILKNRNGKAGNMVAFSYRPRFNYFENNPVGCR